MIRYAFLVFSLSACQTVTWQGQCGKISRTSFGSDLSAIRTTIEIDKDCRHRIMIEGLADNQSEGIKAAAEGAARGAVKGMKP